MLLLSGGVIQVHLSREYEYLFNQIKAKLGLLFLTLLPLIKYAVHATSNLKDLKRYLQRVFQELKPQLAIAESFDDIMDIVRKKCTIINVVCLEAIVNHYKIEEAKVHITTYKTEVDQFCEEVKIRVCKDMDFMTDPSTPITFETIEFILEWKTDEDTLSEIQFLLMKIFQDMAKKVLVKCKL